MNATDVGPVPAKLVGTLRLKLWIAAGCALALTLGVLTRPAPAPEAVAPSPERATPLLEEQVQRREQLRLFGGLQELGPRLARHSVTIAPMPTAGAMPSDVAPLVPRVEPAGHGLLVSADGEVLTTAAALGGREVIDVGLASGRTIEARVVAFDPTSDLVLLQAREAPRTDAAPWAMVPPPGGMLAIAVAHARGHVAVTPVFVTGTAEAEGRIRITALDLLPGTPLYTVDGEVFAVAAGDGDPSAVLVATAVTRLRERIATGQGRRGALGLTFQPLDDRLAEIYPDPGALVADVVAYAPADEAGIAPGDVIVAVGETSVTDVEEARAAIARLAPNTTVTITLSRNGKPRRVEATAASALALRARPSGPADVHEAPDARTLFDPDVREATGLAPNSRILAIAGRPVRTAAAARAELGRARTPVLLYVEADGMRFFRVLERPR